MTSPNQARDVQARVNPSGFVAQRVGDDFNGHGNWILTYMDNHGLQVKALSDDDVANWPKLVPEVL